MTNKKRVSLVLATYNRQELLIRLLRDVEKQTLSRDLFEVIVVDDGSRSPVKPGIDALAFAFDLQVIQQANAGCALARHHGAQRACGDVLVITDDDMQLPPEFLEEHLRLHDAGARVVIGNIQWAERLDEMPLFERFHAEKMKKFYAGFRDGSKPVNGARLCTGNASVRRDDYFEVGGFDSRITNEDRELGIALEKRGCKIVFGEKARAIHDSDHTDWDLWLRRCFDYGVADERIQVKHPDLEAADPWKLWYSVHPLTKVLAVVPTFMPPAGKALSRVAIWAAMGADRLGLKDLAVKGATVCFCLEYFRGMRSETGSLLGSVKRFQAYARKRSAGRC